MNTKCIPLLKIPKPLQRRQVFALVTVLAILACVSNIGRGQNQDTITTTLTPVLGNAIGCSSTECCEHFQLKTGAGGGATHVDITLKPCWSGATDCVDLSCWNGQSTTGITFSHSDGRHFSIDFNPALGANQTFDFYMCAPASCWNSNFCSFDFEVDYGTYSNTGFGRGCPLFGCAGGADLCTGCDSIRIYETDCYVDVCFVNRSGVNLNTFTLHFNPPLQSCNMSRGSGTTGGSPCPAEGAAFPGDIFSADGWTISPSTGLDSVVFTAGTEAAAPCREVCVQFPKCLSGQTSHIITLTDGNECGNTASVVMKAASGIPSTYSNSASPNYPNPVEAGSGFRTIIPFTTAGPGAASIRIVDQAGKEVWNDREDVTYAGKHFFYLTASSLPAGTYFYQIEFPQGVVIQSRTMLVVK